MIDKWSSKNVGGSSTVGLAGQSNKPCRSAAGASWCGFGADETRDHHAAHSVLHVWDFERGHVRCFPVAAGFVAEIIEKSRF